MFTLDEVKGGGPWGAGTFAGPTGARQPSEMELEQAEYEVRALCACIRRLHHLDAALLLIGVWGLGVCGLGHPTPTFEISLCAAQCN